MLDKMGNNILRDTRAPKILVGTFHKTGTNLMLAISRSAARAFGLTIWRADAKITEPAEWDIYFDWHSKFPDAVLSQPHKGVVVFRDPRDVIISGAHYHCKSTEAWVLKPQERFDGLSYQQKIQNLPSDDARFLFEMKNAGAATIRNMLHSLERLTEFMKVKYESLVTDSDLVEFEKIFRFLGFSDARIPALKAIALQNSLFSKQKIHGSVRVRSGMPAQWKQEFSPAVLEAFVSLHGDAAERLGYEPSTITTLNAKCT